MCQSNQPVQPYNVLFKRNIYIGVTMKKPSLQNDLEYWDKYKNHVLSLPNKKDENNIPMGGQMYKTVS